MGQSKELHLNMAIMAIQLFVLYEGVGIGADPQKAANMQVMLADIFL
jgi:hypothetical protein